MALIDINFESKYLSRTTNVYVLKPTYIDKKAPLYMLYLLHGYTGEYTNWIRHSNIERYVSGKNVIVVMPSAYNGYYTDIKGWDYYFSYLTKELPNLIKTTFNVKVPRDNTFIAGLSMGGYGALKAALSYPSKYKKAASFSGAVDIQRFKDDSNLGRKSRFNFTFGKTVSAKNSLFRLAEKSLNKVDLYISCGTEDFLYQDNNRLHEHLEKIGFKHQYITRPGTHDWLFWEDEIQNALKYFFQ